MFSRVSMDFLVVLDRFQGLTRIVQPYKQMVFLCFLGCCSC